MEAVLAKELGLKSIKRLSVGIGGGCISQPEAFQSDVGKLFVKTGRGKEQDVMLRGEYESLVALQEASCVRTPKPVKVFSEGGQTFFVAEFIDGMRGLSRFQSRLGTELARLHLHNREFQDTDKERYISKFGFHTPTCCGRIPQDNTWDDNWPRFFAERRIQLQVDLIGNDSELLRLWQQLKPRVPELFDGLKIEPSLMHGDLWAGNASETADGPVIYDPSSFFGHDEYDLGIASMFGGFSREFWSAYHALIPKASGFAQRNELYEVFHYLNHWNHFGTGYRSSSISTMRSVLNSLPKK